MERIKCTMCGKSITEVPISASYEGLMCDRCYDESETEECDICGQYHPVGFEGDCRDNSQRKTLDKIFPEL